MSVDADLATLREYAYIGAGVVMRRRREVKDANEGVEAELSRLREQRDEEMAHHTGEAYDNGFANGIAVEAARAEAAEARCARLQQMLGAAFRECEDDISVVVCDCDVDPEATCLAHRILALAGLDTPASCEKCRHAAHEPGQCDAYVGTGYHGPVLCRCEAGLDTPADSQEDKT